MSKRRRESSVEFIVRDDHTEIRYNNKAYYWDHPIINFDKLMKCQDDDYEFYITHDSENKALLVLEDLKKNSNLFQFSINPLKYGDVSLWYADE